VLLTQGNSASTRHGGVDPGLSKTCSSDSFSLWAAERFRGWADPPDGSWPRAAFIF
jgi:hypothetical protein